MTLLILCPLLGAVLIALSGGADPRRIRTSALLTSVATLLLAVWALVMFYAAADPPGSFVLQQQARWWGGVDSAIDVSYHVGVDAISIWLIMLTAFITPLAVWASFTSIGQRVKEYYALMLILEMGMLGVFCSMDLLLFYVFFEFTLIPLFFLIGIWGGSQRAKAANKFFLYTVAGSVLTFAAILFVAFLHYTNGDSATLTFDIQALSNMGRDGLIDPAVQWWIFLGLAAGFAIKVPLFPVHTWLPLAHTEAPTAGSVVLAGVLLKLGSYGFVRLSLPILPQAAEAFAPWMGALAVCGIIYGALAAWVQRDVKKLVAYSSVSHMGFCILGMFSLKIAGVTGSVLYMVNHGLATGALFLVVGMIYERYHTRDVENIGGLARQMPWMAFFLIIFTLSSIGLPGMNGFVSEFLVLAGTAASASQWDGLAPGPLGMAFAVPAALGIVLGAIYMLHMCRCLLFGPLKEPSGTPDTSCGLTKDLTRREISILAPIAAACLVLGVWPKPLIQSLEPAIEFNILAARANAGESVALAPPDMLDSGDAVRADLMEGDSPNTNLALFRLAPGEVADRCILNRSHCMGGARNGGARRLIKSDTQFNRTEAKAQLGY